MALETVKICVLIDANGDCGRGADRAEAIEDYEARIQPLADSNGHRFLEIELANVRTPGPVEVTGDMGETDDEPTPTLSVK